MLFIVLIVGVMLSSVVGGTADAFVFPTKCINDTVLSFL